MFLCALAQPRPVWQAAGVTPALRRPLLATCIVLTALTGVAAAGIGIASAISNPKTFGVGVALMLGGYGALLVFVAWLVARGHAWALNLIVASGLLHVLVLASFLTTDDRAQFIGSLIVLPFVAATVVTSTIAVGRRELERTSRD